MAAPIGLCAGSTRQPVKAALRSREVESLVFSWNGFPGFAERFEAT